MKYKNVLVTGANGFTGSYLTKLLVDMGYNVAGLIRNKNLVNLGGYENKINIIQGDVRNDEIVKKSLKNNDIVYHFASHLGVNDVKGVLTAAKNPIETASSNILGTLNVIKNAVSNNVKRFIFISTCHVYGEQPVSALPIKETTIPNPLDIFSCSKYSAELCLKPFMDKIDIVITRAFNMVGGGHIGDYFVPKVITNHLKGIKSSLWNPNTTRDFSYVEDVVEGYRLAGENGRSGEIYQFSSGVETSMGELLKVIERVFGENINVEWRTDRPQDFSRSFGDSTKSRAELKWQPKLNLYEAIEKTVDWWKNHPMMWNLVY